MSDTLYHVWMIYNHYGHHLPEPVKMTNYPMDHEHCVTFKSKMTNPTHHMLIPVGKEEEYGI